MCFFRDIVRDPDSSLCQVTLDQTRVHCKVSFLPHSRLVLCLSSHGWDNTVFPDIVLSSAYLILRPFFRPVSPPVSDDPLNPKNWVFGAYLTKAHASNVHH